MKGALLSKSGLMALAFGAEAAAAASSTVQDPAAAAAPAQPAAAAAGDENKDPAAAPAAEKTGDEGGEKKEPAASVAAAPEIDPAAAETGDTVLASTALEGMADVRAKGRDEGFAAANERCRLVLESAEGQANHADAKFMLFHSDAKAATIVANLKARGAPTGGGQRQAAQPRINLTDGNGASTASADAPDSRAFDPWAQFSPPSVLGNQPIVIGGQNFTLTPASAQPRQ